ncbi:hypothetical protein L873DRAFT_26108 [Choiromyces venosus 120613-1]|uniref:Uncharacterized protein n=1 Tax=Choiromyces venosus 120613-1 TaxID=1336337 RepID=A0A3N4K6H9_9PEZI|nr:hypothetical protein L873DRAFT_26108 [Choiromyces venosus 120613-1]
MPHSRTQTHRTHQPLGDDQNPIPNPAHHHHKANGVPLRRAARSLESWLLSDLGRLSMTSTTTTTTTPNPAKPPISSASNKTKRPKSPARICYTHTHYTCSSSLCEHSCSSSLASESSSRGPTPPSTSSSSSSSSSSIGSADVDDDDDGEDDGLSTYMSAMELQGRALKPFGYERREVVQVLREVESGRDDDDDDGDGVERERGGRKRFWR